MSEQISPPSPRILLAAAREMDGLARRFRCRLREVALDLAQQDGGPVVITPETVARAVPVVSQEFHLNARPRLERQEDPDGRNSEAA